MEKLKAERLEKELAKAHEEAASATAVRKAWENERMKDESEAVKVSKPGVRVWF